MWTWSEQAMAQSARRRRSPFKILSFFCSMNYPTAWRMGNYGVRLNNK
ncbi:MAG: hypothetical protein KME30_16615 [Iphinoe sp. HA4291-MV1]|nr:hypothetical protein [Iphinoe sp. HA4291-MV1]